MKSRIICAFRIPSLLLAASLQVLPIVRAALPATETAANVLAIVFRWVAGAAAALGGVQAVSGASTVITNPLTAAATQGQSFTLRLTTAPNQAQYWTATGLPAGISLSGQNGSSFWQLLGTPTGTGTFSVGLTAYEQQGSSHSTSSTLVLTISAAVSTPPGITTQPASQTVAQGQNATFSVVATGTAPLSYQWRFNSANLSGQTSSTLTLNSVTTADTGNYDVIVSNSNGSVTSVAATLTVSTSGNVPPAITTPPANLTVAQGQNATFSVAATGTAPLTYYWSKGTTLVAGPAGSSFTLTSAQPADAGSYSVTVSNSVGTATSSPATLTVTAASQAPYIITPPVNQSVLSGGTAAFVVLAGGSTPLRYHWYLNGESIDGATAASLTIPNVQSANAGTYYVVISNSHGSVTSPSAQLALISIQGTYTGLYYESGGVSQLSSGFITIACTGGNKYSGSLMLLGKRYSLSGQFNFAGFATNTVQRGSLNALSVELQVDLTGADLIRGRVTDGFWSAPLLANRAVFNKNTNPAPQAGTYTLMLPGNSGSTSIPAGDSFGTVTVDAGGGLRFAGTLADGTKVAQSTTISKSGDWPLYVSLYSGMGSGLGWQTFANRPGDDINGPWNWLKLQQPSALYYPGGFAFQTQSVGSKFVPPAGNTVLNFSSGQLWLTGGNLAQNITNPIVLGANNKVANVGGTKIALAIAPSSGLFSGSVIDPATGKSISVSGVVLQKPNIGCGFFLGRGAGWGVSQSGWLYLGP